MPNNGVLVVNRMFTPQGLIISVFV